MEAKSMFQSKRWSLLLLSLVTGLTGCSSIDTWSGSEIPPSPYAGTRNSRADIVSTVRADSGPEALGKVFLPLMAVDFVGSAAADTLVLLATLIGQANRHAGPESN
jgi:uncharacterized protein YceK